MKGKRMCRGTREYQFRFCFRRLKTCVIYHYTIEEGR